MENLFGTRLQNLRVKQGLSLQDVASEVGVSRQSIHKFEQGEASPRTEIVLKLASFFRVTYGFFYEQEISLGLDKVCFREEFKLDDKTGLELELKRELLKFLNQFLQLRKLLGLKNEFLNPVAEVEVATDKDVEKVTKLIRKKWKLGIGPIPDVVNMLESNGIIVFEMQIPQDFEGLSAMVDDRLPVMLLNSRKENVERKRFTALHELAHLLLMFAKHHSVGKIEYLCDCFAGAMLLVDEVLPNELGKARTVVSLAELIRIKEKYGVSVKAIIVRAKCSGFIDDRTHRQWWQAYDEYSQHHLMGNPTRQFSLEKPSTFSLMIIQGINEKRIQWSKAAELTGKKIDVLKTEIKNLQFSINEYVFDQ